MFKSSILCLLNVGSCYVICFPSFHYSLICFSRTTHLSVFHESIHDFHGWLSG